MGEANPEHTTVVSLKCVGSTGREGKKNLWHFKCQGMGVKAKLCLVSLMLPAAETLRVRRAPSLSSGGFNAERHLGMYTLDSLQLVLCVTVSKKGAVVDSEHE